MIKKLFFLLKNFFKSKPIVTTPPKKLSESEKSIESLLSLEKYLLVNGYQETHKLVFVLLNNIFEIITELNENYPGMAYQLNNMSQDILPRRIHSSINTVERVDIFIEDIDKMLKIVEDTKRIILNNKITKDEREALLIQLKY